MTLLTHRGAGASFPYAGQPTHILAGQDGQPPGFRGQMRDIYHRHASRLLP